MKAQKRWQTSLAIAAIVPAGIVSACTANIGDKGFGPGSNGSGASSGAIGADGGGSAAAMAGSGSGGSAGSGSDPRRRPDSPVAIVPSAGNSLAAESAGPMIMRRVTYREYDHMLADLLGDTTAPAETGNTWSPDSQNATGYITPNSVADLQVQLYNKTADTMIATALAAVAAGKPAGKFAIPCQNPATPAAETTCVTQFITTFGQQAYRRPIVAAEQADLMTVFTTVRKLIAFPDSVGAVARVMVQSPNFLYHWEIGPTKPVVGADGLVALTPWQVASRLSQSLWESMPDDKLLSAAQAGQLSSPTQVVAQVQRMLADPKSAQSLANFHQQWLFTFGVHVGDVTQPIVKSSPLFTPAAEQGIATEFSMFLSSVYQSAGDGTLNSLFTAPYTYVNRDLAALYGVVGPGTGFAKVALNQNERGGIFTQTAFLATLANDLVDNPIFRGIAIYNRVLCGALDPPPGNVPPVNFIRNGTTRQSYDAHGSGACAQGCHNLFDPPGFAFENYDGNGQYRTKESGQSVDSTGTFMTPSGAAISFKSAIDLSKQLAQTPEAQACIERQWSRYVMGRMETAAEQGSMQLAYQQGAKTSGFSVRDMLAALLSSKAFMYRQPSVGEPL